MPFINGKATNIEDRIKGLEDEARAILGLLGIGVMSFIWAITRLTERITTMNGRTAKLETMAISPEQSPAGKVLNAELQALEQTVKTLTTGLTTVANTSLNHETWHREQDLATRITGMEQYIALNRFLIKLLTGSMALVIPTLLAFMLYEFV